MTMWHECGIMVTEAYDAILIKVPSDFGLSNVISFRNAYEPHSKKKYAIDFSEVKDINGSVIGMLHCMKSAKSNAEISVINATDLVRNKLKICKLESVL